eukprot:g701.t1
MRSALKVKRNYQIGSGFVDCFVVFEPSNRLLQVAKSESQSSADTTYVVDTFSPIPDPPTAPSVKKSNAKNGSSGRLGSSTSSKKTVAAKPRATATHMKLVTEMTSGFDRIWWNKGSSSVQTAGELSVWRPQTPDGCVSLGDICVKGYDEPKYCTCIVDDKSGIVAKPEGYMLLYGQKSIGAAKGAAKEALLHIWKPIAPAGYNALGLVVSIEDRERGDRPSLPGAKPDSKRKASKHKKVIVTAGKMKGKSGRINLGKGKSGGSKNGRKVLVRVDGKDSIYSESDIQIDTFGADMMGMGSNNDNNNNNSAASLTLSEGMIVDVRTGLGSGLRQGKVVQVIAEDQIENDVEYDVTIEGSVYQLAGSMLVIDGRGDELKIMSCVRITYCVPTTVKATLLRSSIDDRDGHLPAFPVSGRNADDDDEAGSKGHHGRRTGDGGGSGRGGLSSSVGSGSLWPMSWFSVDNQASTFVCQMGDRTPGKDSLLLFDFDSMPVELVQQRKQHLPSRRVTEFERVWWNKSVSVSMTTSGVEPIAIWRPRVSAGSAAAGCKVLGHCFTKGWAAPTVALVARAGAPVKRPLCYEMVWRNNTKASSSSSSSSSDDASGGAGGAGVGGAGGGGSSTVNSFGVPKVSIWQPKAPPGHHVLGMVAIPGWDEPCWPKDQAEASPPEATIWCVPNGSLEYSSFADTAESWNNRGKAADKTLVSFHKVSNQANTFFCKKGGVLTPELIPNRLWPHSLYEDKVEFAKGVTDFELRDVRCADFEKLWTSQSGQHVHNLSLFRPSPARMPAGFVPLSHVAWSVLGNETMPAGLSTMVVRRCQSDAVVVPPIKYELVYEDDTVANAKVRLRLWRPVPPPDYVAVGAVATTTKNAEPPTLDSVCVVHKFFAAAAGLRGLYWSDNSEEVGVWASDAGDRLFLSGRGEDRPVAFNIVADISRSPADKSYQKQEAELVPVTSFACAFPTHKAYTEADTSPDQRIDSDLTVWRPDPQLLAREGLIYFGDIATTGHRPAVVMVARDPASAASAAAASSAGRGSRRRTQAAAASASAGGVPPADSDAYASPTGWELVWHASAPAVNGSGSGGERTWAVWMPYAPSGYHFLGCMATESATKPPSGPAAAAFRCVHAKLLAGGPAYEAAKTYGAGSFMKMKVWGETRGEGSLPFGIWQIGDPRLGCFMTGEGHASTAPDSLLCGGYDGCTLYSHASPENDETGHHEWGHKVILKRVSLDVQYMAKITDGHRYAGQMARLDDGAVVAGKLSPRQEYTVEVDTEWNPRGEAFTKKYERVPGSQLRVMKREQLFKLVWSSGGGSGSGSGSGSGISPLSIFEPILPSDGCLLLGHCAVPSETEMPSTACVIFKEQGNRSSSANGKRAISDPLWANPIGFELIFAESYGGTATAGTPLYVWMPKGPTNYYALGCVVTTDKRPPDASKFAVVHKRCLDDSQASFRLWQGCGSGDAHALKKGGNSIPSLWACESGANTFLATCSALVPPNGLAWSMCNPIVSSGADAIVEVCDCGGFETLSPDGSYEDFGRLNGYPSFWRPISEAEAKATSSGTKYDPVNDPWRPVGDIFTARSGKPGSEFVVPLVSRSQRDEVNDVDVVQLPTGYVRVTELKATAPGDDRELVVWMPICPPNYVACGAVLRPKGIVPQIDEYRVVYWNYAKRAGLARCFWFDGQTRMRAAWAVENSTRTVLFHIGPGKPSSGWRLSTKPPIVMKELREHAIPTIDEAMRHIEEEHQACKREGRRVGEGLPAPLLDFATTTDLELVFDTTESSEYHPYSAANFYKPRLSAALQAEGWQCLGHVCVNKGQSDYFADRDAGGGVSSSSRSLSAADMPKVVIARELRDDGKRTNNRQPRVLAKPIYYERVYMATGEAPFSIWHPVSPRGFKALGDVCHASLEEPSLDLVRAVSIDWLEGTSNINLA